MFLRDLGALADPARWIDLREAANTLFTSEPVVITDSAVVNHEISPATVRKLRDLPAPTVLVGDPRTADPHLVGAVDVCLTTERNPPKPWVYDSIDAVHAAVRKRPMAALALALLLRSAGRLDLPGQVWAETITYATLLGSKEHHAWRNGAIPQPDLSSQPSVVCIRDNDELFLELNRPDRRNAVNTDMRDALTEALGVAEADPTIERVTLSGRGRCFSAGGDLREFGLNRDPATSVAVRMSRHPGMAIARIADRVVARLHGACIGAGIEIPAFAGQVVAAPDVSIRLPEVAMGLIPGAGGTVSITRRIGRHRLCWLALTGTAIDSSTAQRWGLVDRVDQVPLVAASPAR